MYPCGSGVSGCSSWKGVAAPLEGASGCSPAEARTANSPGRLDEKEGVRCSAWKIGGRGPRRQDCEGLSQAAYVSIQPTPPLRTLTGEMGRGSKPRLHSGASPRPRCWRRKQPWFHCHHHPSFCTSFDKETSYSIISPI